MLAAWWKAGLHVWPCVIFLFGTSAAFAGLAAPVPLRILAKPLPRASRKELEELYTRNGCRLRRQYKRMDDLQVLEVATPVDLEAVLRRYRNSLLFEYVEADSLLRATYLPNDPELLNGNLWNLRHLAGQIDADIDAPEAWDIERDASSIIVAVIDSGVRYTHQDLGGNMWRNPGESSNRLDDDGNGYVNDIHGINAINGSGSPFDNHGHGTHVAGIIGAVADNGVGCVGVAFRVRIMALKCLDENLYGFASDAIECIDYARAHGARIINASWGDYSGEFTSEALREAIARARDDGIIFAAAAGNDGRNIDRYRFYPASHKLENMIVVAATTSSDALASWSNYGPGTVDLAAPGNAVYSTWADSDSSYRDFTGTSMAAPHVAGACALVWAHFPWLNYREVMERVLSSTDPLPSLAGKVGTGGRLNLRRALTSLNTAPVLASIPAQAVHLGGTVTFTATATDAETSPSLLRFGLDAAAPAGAQINEVTGQFAWTPTGPEALGAHTITVWVKDDGSPPLIASQTMNIAVLPPLRIVSVNLLTAGKIELGWNSALGGRYQLQSQENLGSNWSDIGDSITATGESTKATDILAPGSSRFYRVINVQ